MDLRNPAVRWGIGLSSGAMVAAIGLLVLEGTTQLLVFGIAVFDTISTPLILKQAVED
ncbi:hypothetical protein [Natrinema soli]|uniref:Uncharacterized protein n=1 Tax=Natrinema soli TaxID=1930624 RepID=A0ABD5SNH8_9EURY|nr:hypothetical protein [Natrinema soli]